MSRDEVMEIVLSEIPKVVDCSKIELTGETDLIDELGFSSFTFFILMTRLEQRTGVFVMERKVRRMETIDDIVNGLME